MTYQEKAALMILGLSIDYFGYGTMIKRLKSGKFKVIIDGETFYHTLHTFANEWDNLPEKDKEDLLWFFEGEKSISTSNKN